MLTNACATDQKVPKLEPTSDSLLCTDCEIVDVNEVIDANTLDTSTGNIQLYGAYVIDQPADCAELAVQRLRSLASNQVRIDPGPVDTIRQDNDHYYLFTLDGKSIEERLIREGLALTWTQDGQHLGWFIFQDAEAKANDSGCLWHDYQAFQRGDPNEFRIPGLTQRD